MAINFLNNVNFNSIQSENIVIENFATDVLAGNGVSGQIYWNTTSEELKGWDGSVGAWVSIGSDNDLLSFSGDAGTGTVLLKNQVLAIDGTTNEIKTSGTGQALTISLADGSTAGTRLTLTGTPFAPTATAGTNTNQIATTAFVTTAVAAVDTLAEILSVGNTTDGSDIAMSAGDDITFTSSSAI